LDEPQEKKRMPRITLPAPEAMDQEQRRVYDKIVSGRRGKIQGPLRAALHSAELADRWQALGELLRYRTTLTPRLSELAILVTARACRSPFEWYAHRLEAERVGIEPAIIEAILHDAVPPGLSEGDSAVYEHALELNRLRSVTDATYAKTLARFGERAVVELTALVGYYTMVAMTLNAHEIPLPDGVTPAFALPQREEGV
jgi:4-carboxymuconolactone decarboxylase